MRKRQGFTIVELLIVISIIGILVMISLIGLKSARSRAIDLQVRSDVNSLRRALVAYAADHGGRYPLSNTDGNSIEFLQYDKDKASKQSPTGTTLVKHEYIDNIPSSPVTNKPYYYWSNGKTYILDAKLFAIGGSYYEAYKSSDDDEGAKVVMKTLDSPPFWVNNSFVAEKKDAGKLDVSWGYALTKMQLSPIRYNLYYKKASESDWNSVDTGDSTKITLNNLDSAVYNLKVSACDDAGHETSLTYPVDPPGGGTTQWFSEIKVDMTNSSLPSFDPGTFGRQIKYCTFDGNCSNNFSTDYPKTRFTEWWPTQNNQIVLLTPPAIDSSGNYVTKYVFEYCKIDECASDSDWKQLNSTDFIGDYYGVSWPQGQRFGIGLFNLPGGTYNFRVYGVDNDGNRTYLTDGSNNTYVLSNVMVSGSETGDIQPPAFPKNPDLNGTSNWSKQPVTLSWPAAGDNVGVDHYTVTVKCGHGYPFVPNGAGYSTETIQTRIVIPTSEWTCGPYNGTNSYAWAVTAYDQAGNHQLISIWPGYFAQ